MLIAMVNFLSMVVQFILASFLFITAFVICCLFITFIVACIWELFLIAADTFNLLFLDTNGNKIRKMNDREMAEYFLANYQLIGHFKGKFNSVNQLVLWLKSKEDC